MKQVWLVLLMVIPGVLAADKEPAAVPVKVAIELVDGSRNIGTLAITAIPMATPFAKMDIPIERIRRILFDKEKKAVVVELRNGDKVTGTTDLAAFKLTALFGPVSIAIEHVTRLSVVMDKPSRSGSGALTDKDRKVEEKMKKIILPEVDFHQASIADVVTFLSESSREFDEREGAEESDGVSFGLNLRFGAEKGRDLTVEPEGEGPAAFAEGASLITFNARNISLLEALKIITKVAGLDYTIENGVVMIHPKESD